MNRIEAKTYRINRELLPRGWPHRRQDILVTVQRLSPELVHGIARELDARCYALDSDVAMPNGDHG